MKQTGVFTALVMSLAIVTLPAYAASPLLEMRSKIARDATDIKSVMSTSRDSYLVSSMWDACLLTLSQLDAYFSMIGIFNTIPKDLVSKDAIAYLDQWLTEIRRVTDLNITSMAGMKKAIDPATRIRIDILTKDFGSLNRLLDSERARVMAYKQAVRK